MLLTFRCLGLTSEQPWIIFKQEDIINQMTKYQAAEDRKSLPTRGIKGSPAVWIQEKKVRDAQLWGSDTSKLWIIQNKLYDLTSFIDKHPGGRNWLTMTQGQDVTDFFIIHHLNEDKARAQLSKYYVGETKNRLARFTFEENGLYRTVKRKVLKQMSVFDIQNEATSKKYGLILLSLFLVFLGLSAASIDVENGSLKPYFFAAFCSLILVGLIGIGHNFVHHKANYFKYYFVFAGFTHDEWQIMHCLSHHIYPNTELDFEAAALEPIGYFLRTMPLNKRYTEIILILLFIFIQPINMILKTIVVPIIKQRKPDFWYTIPLLVLILFYYASGENIWAAFKLHIFMYGLFGFMFNRVLFCGHRLQELWTEGAERINDFGEHTVLSTSDTDTGLEGFWSYLLLGGFNIHTPHHFFPTADHAALPKILKIIDETCKEMNIKHTTNTRIACFKSISKGIVSRIPFERH